MNYHQLGPRSDLEMMSWDRTRSACREQKCSSHKPLGLVGQGYHLGLVAGEYYSRSFVRDCWIRSAEIAAIHASQGSAEVFIANSIPFSRHGLVLGHEQS